MNQLTWISATTQVAASVADFVEIMNISVEAWESIDARTFQASWLVCGYFDETHFAQVPHSQVASVKTVEEAKHVLDPSGLLDGTSIIATPQYCTTFEWRIQDLLT